MRRSIVSVVATLLAFVAGVGVNRLIWAPSEKNTAPAPRAETVAAVAAVAPPAVPVNTPLEPLREGKIIFDYNDDTFFPDGSYYIEGKTPKEFAEFSGFSITYYEDNDGTGGDIMFFTKTGETYDEVPVIFGWVTERRVIFLTAPHLKTQVEYRFDGEFIQSDADAANGTAVLRGTLTKTDGGRKVAQRVIRLRREQHAC
ncbi:MAG TPA: hypothetical protein VFY60_00565 [Pyrinomonadaceae bacterium]|nr:hypothetical protein [Pyrinomonadaceae bacterium]